MTYSVYFILFYFIYFFICSQNVTFKRIVMYKESRKQGTDNRH